MKKTKEVIIFIVVFWFGNMVGFVVVLVGWLI
jgi:hypothetical protein